MTKHLVSRNDEQEYIKWRSYYENWPDRAGTVDFASTYISENPFLIGVNEPVISVKLLLW